MSWRSLTDHMSVKVVESLTDHMSVKVVEVVLTDHMSGESRGGR